MKQLFLWLTGLVGWFPIAQVLHANPTPLLAEISLESPVTSVVGTPRKLRVDILTATWFIKAPTFPDLTIPGALVVAQQGFGTNFSVRRDGQNYAAQRREYLIFPQRAGPYRIPALSLQAAAAGVDGMPTAARSVNTRALTFEAQQLSLPEGVEPGEYAVTPALDVSDSYSDSINELRVGDGLIRTVRLVAEQTLGMMLPQLRFDAPDGVRVYVGKPDIGDRSSRGELQGLRTETVTYLFDRTGAVSIPSLHIHWWNPASYRWENSRLPALRINIQPLIAPSVGEQQGFSNDRVIRYLVLAVTLVVVLWLGRRRTKWRWQGMVNRKNGADSERSLYRQLANSCRRESPRLVLRALYRWQDQVRDDDRRASCNELVVLVEVDRERKQLETMLFGDPSSPLQQEPAGSSQALWRALRRQRKQLKKQQRRTVSAPGGLDPQGPLNPVRN